MAAALGVWRLASDMGASGQFGIEEGLFSHWQIWIPVSVVLQGAAMALNRYGLRQPDRARAVTASAG